MSEGGGRGREGVRREGDLYITQRGTTYIQLSIAGFVVFHHFHSHPLLQKTNRFLLQASNMPNQRLQKCCLPLRKFIKIISKFLPGESSQN